MKILILNCSPVRSGATAEICRLMEEALRETHEVYSTCIDDYSIQFCRGCRTCHETASCVLRDDTNKLMAHFARADAVVCVSPSYWADVPGQFKVFIDRCTPWCNTHEPHAALPVGKKGYAVALRTGPSPAECEKIVGTIAHFYGHLEIEMCGSLTLCGIPDKEALSCRKEEILRFCDTIR